LLYLLSKPFVLVENPKAQSSYVRCGHPQEMANQVRLLHLQISLGARGGKMVEDELDYLRLGQGWKTLFSSRLSVPIIGN
jgi:hypothetical protein